MSRESQKKLTKLSETAKELNSKQRLFCQLYVKSQECFSNGTKAYKQAYGCSDATARVNSSKLLTNTNILSYMDEILYDEGLNDVFVDKELHWIIMQKDNLSAKLGGIREYNRLKGRVKASLTSSVQHNWFMDMVGNAEERADDVVDAEYEEVDIKSIVEELEFDTADT